MSHIFIDTALPIPPESYDVLLQLLEKAECQIKRSAHISIKPPVGNTLSSLTTSAINIIKMFYGILRKNITSIFPKFP